MTLPGEEKIPLLLGVFIFGLLGLAMLWGAWHFSNETRAFLPLSQSAEGKVIALRQSVSKDSDNKTTVAYYPTIEFTAKDGRTFKFASNLAVDEQQYPVGASIKILYNKSNPNDARIDSFDSLWGTTIMLAVLGSAFAGVPVFVYFLLYREAEIDAPLVAAAGFACVALLLYAGAWWLSRDGVYLLKHGMRTTGTVVAVFPAPLVQFWTFNEKLVKYHPHTNSDPPKYAQGDRVPILYDPEEPTKAAIDSFDELWLGTTVIGAMGTAFLLAGVFAVYAKVRND